MTKGTKLSEFEKGEITALETVGKEISKALECSKTVNCYYLKSLNKYGTRKPTSGPENLSPQLNRSKKENFINIKNIEISRGCSLQYENN